MNAEIINALIRCTRNDRIAYPVFEFVHQEQGIWVRELPLDLVDLITDLSTIQPLLTTLRGSADYTLHLAATVDSVHLLKLPTELTRLAADCGFAIELVGAHNS